MSSSVLAQSVLLCPPAPDCPIAVVAARVPSAQEGDPTVRYASGWGASPREAAESCTWEVVERLAAQIHGMEAIKRAKARALGAAAVLPPELLLIAEDQYARRGRWNARHGGFNELPARWKPDQTIDWILSTARLGPVTRWLPAGLCFLGHARDRAAGLPPADSNGLAAGNSIEDACVRAFLELVERDAVAIWWYNRLARPRLQPGDLREPLVTAYSNWSQSRGRPLRLYDLTHDLEIPVVAAVAADASGGSIALGFGAGASTAEAARHAVGELAQFEHNIASIMDRVPATDPHEPTAEAQALLHWYRTARTTDHPHLAGDAVAVPRAVAAPHNLEQCHALCARHDLRFLALDLTRAALGIPVVRVVVPGLRPLWARFAPGRLYDVPVRLGWRSVPLPADKLEPTPLMF